MKNLLIILSICFSSVTYSQTDEEYILKGKAKYDIQDYKGAIDYYSKAIEINPKNKESYFYIGIAKCDLQDYNEAIISYSKAIE